MSKRALVVLGVLALLTVVVPLAPARAADCPIEFWDCWNPSGHPNCTGSDSTPSGKTKVTPVGLLELRYRSAPCRHIWGRIVNPSGSFSNLFAQRVTGPSGSTSGLSWINAGSTYWSKMLNDQGYTGRATLVVGGTPYDTPSY